MTKWFMGDPHWHHENVLKMCERPFECIADHDEYLLAQINRLIPKNDTLYILGDVAWHSPHELLKRITCKNIHLIWGNHDRPNFASAFKSCQDVLDIKIGEQHVWLSHYAHAYWPGSHRNWMHLYGHTHSEREVTLDTIWPERRSMDVGVDNAKRLLGEYRPFSEHDVMRILGPRAGHDPVEFYKNKRGQ